MARHVRQGGWGTDIWPMSMNLIRAVWLWRSTKRGPVTGRKREHDVLPTGQQKPHPPTQLTAPRSRAAPVGEPRVIPSGNADLATVKSTLGSLLDLILKLGSSDAGSNSVWQWPLVQDTSPVQRTNRAILTTRSGEGSGASPQGLGPHLLLQGTDGNLSF